MSGVPVQPPPGSAGPGPSTPPPYGPYFPYPYSPPPKRDNIALIIVLIVVIFVLVPVVFAAILYVMVSGLLSGPTPPMIVTFDSVTQAGGNATIPVFGASREFSPSDLRIRLEANGSSSGIAALPPPDGSVAMAIANTTYRVFWLDQDHDGTFGAGDALWVTGNLAPLPPSTRFTLFLLNVGGATISGAGWTTA